jgi:hypothetical protein
VCPQGERPATVRALFHSSTVDRASTGCLLEQVHQAQPAASAARTHCPAAPSCAALAPYCIRSTEVTARHHRLHCRWHHTSSRPSRMRWSRRAERLQSPSSQQATCAGPRCSTRRRTPWPRRASARSWPLSTSPPPSFGCATKTLLRPGGAKTSLLAAHMSTCCCLSQSSSDALWLFHLGNCRQFQSVMIQHLHLRNSVEIE